jgi:hypothetical protein
MRNTALISSYKAWGAVHLQYVASFDFVVIPTAAMYPSIVDNLPPNFHHSVGAKISTVQRIYSPPNSLGQHPQAQREKLLASLRGQTIHIPDLKPLFQRWPSATSPHLQRIQDDVCGYLNR